MLATIEASEQMKLDNPVKVEMTLPFLKSVDLNQNVF